MYNPRERVDFSYQPFTIGFFLANIKREVSYPVTFQIFDYYGKVFANTPVTVKTSVQHVPPEYYCLLKQYGDDYFVKINEGAVQTTSDQGKITIT